MSAVSDLDLHCLHICPRKRLICAQIQMIGPVTNLFSGHLPTATVLGNYSLHAVIKALRVLVGTAALKRSNREVVS